MSFFARKRATPYNAANAVWAGDQQGRSGLPARRPVLLSGENGRGGMPPTRAVDRRRSAVPREEKHVLRRSHPPSRPPNHQCSRYHHRWWCDLVLVAQTLTRGSVPPARPCPTERPTGRCYLFDKRRALAEAWRAIAMAPRYQFSCRGVVGVAQAPMVFFIKEDARIE